MTFPPQSVQVCKVGQRLFSFVLSKLLGWASSLDVRGSISIIELKGGDRSIKKGNQSSNPTGAPAGISE